MPKRFLIALLLLLLLFFPLVWISQYNYPSGDDFYMASLAKRLGALEATKWWYFNEAGRYSYIFLQSLISTSNSWLVIYKAFPVVLLVAGFASLYYFVRAFWGRALTKTTSFILAAALYALLISLTPDIATAFYWLNTNIQYAGAVFTSLVIFALYIDFYRIAKTSTRVAYALMIAILIIILAGLNEVSVLLFIATFGFINFLFILKFKRLDKWVLAFFFVSVVFSLVSFLATVTHARALEVIAEFHLLNVLAGSVALTVYLL